MKHKAFAPPSIDPNSEERISPLVNWDTLECVYPDYPRIEEIEISHRDRECWLDLRPYIDLAPLTINEHASVARGYRMFRTLGLHHLIVVSHRNEIRGIATREDFVALDVEAKDVVTGHSTTSSIHSNTGNGDDDDGDSSPHKRRQRRAHRTLQHTINFDLGL